MHVPVVVVTALSLECSAVCAHLTDLEEHVSQSNTVFDIGTLRIGSRCLQIAVAEIGPGNSSAGIETGLAIASFRPSVVLFVGIAGGIKEVAIGDVVAATKIYGYESGKADSSFHPRPEVASSSWRLEQQGRAVARKGTWLLRRENSKASPENPRVFVGPICAGEKVISSTRSEVYRFIRSAYNDALAVEMEGHSFLDAARRTQVDALVIRGISDLLDGKATVDARGSQEAAARNAAAFAIEVLARLEIPDAEAEVAQSVQIEARNNIDANPYRGLQYFDVDDEEYFFGREALTGTLLTKMQDLSRDPCRVLGIIGPSGSGKSSIARAGLVAQLTRSAIPGSDRWPAIICRPGSDPIESIAVALTASRHEGTASLRSLIDDLTNDDRTLHLFALNLVASQPSNSRVVLLVDQFEEIFTLCDDIQLRRAFIDNLLYAARKKGGPCTVVLTLRADQYYRCSEYPDFADAIASRHVLIGPLTDRDARAAIEEPAHKCGRSFEAGLIDRLIGDAMSRPGDLPLLQHALMELWSRQVNFTMTHEAYAQIGGIQGAMVQRAEWVYAALNPHERRLCQLLFVRLSQAGETIDTRQPVPIREVVPASFPPTMGDDVIAAFTHQDARLLVVGRSPGDDLPVVEVAHEALLRTWPRLIQWLNDDRDAHRFHFELSHAARAWNANGRQGGYLLRGEGLKALAAWVKDHGDEMNALEHAFTSACAQLEAGSLLQISRESVATVISDIWQASDLVLPEVRTLLEGAKKPESKRRLHMALIREGEAHVTYLVDQLLAVDPSEHALLLGFLEAHASDLLDLLWRTVLDRATDPAALVRASCALARLAPLDPRWADVGPALARDVLLENQLFFGQWIIMLKPIGKVLGRPLRSIFRNGDVDLATRHAAATAVAALSDSAASIGEILVDSPRESYEMLFRAMLAAPESDGAVEVLRNKLTESYERNGPPAHNISVAHRRAAALASLLRLGQVDLVTRGLANAQDVELATQFANRHADQCVTISDLLPGLLQAPSPTARNVIVQALGSFKPDAPKDPEKQAVAKKLLSLYETDKSSAVHSSAGWVLRKWGLQSELVTIDKRVAGQAVSNEWFVLACGEEAFTMVMFDASTYMMGSPVNEMMREDDESQHEVRICTPFAISDRPITRGQFQRVVKKFGGSHSDVGTNLDQGPEDAIVDVTWHEAMEFCRALTVEAGFTTNGLVSGPPTRQTYGAAGFRLPTEAEWECACRASTETPFSFGSDMRLLQEYAWFADNSENRVRAVANLRPNPRGLFDVHGNVYEWCYDWHADYDISRTPAVDPMGAVEGDRRVVRGGCWFYDGRFTRSAYRGDTRFPGIRYHDIGFRIVCDLSVLRQISELREG